MLCTRRGKTDCLQPSTHKSRVVDTAAGADPNTQDEISDGSGDLTKLAGPVLRLEHASTIRSLTAVEKNCILSDLSHAARTLRPSPGETLENSCTT